METFMYVSVRSREYEYKIDWFLATHHTGLTHYDLVTNEMQKKAEASQHPVHAQTLTVAYSCVGSID
jgi:hypothetical protein